MEVYRGVTIYRNSEPIFYGSVLPRQETQILSRYEKKAWPKNGDSGRPSSALTKTRLRTQSSVSSEKKFTNYADGLFHSSKKNFNIESSNNKRPTSANVELVNRMKKEFRTKTETVNMT